MSTADEKRAVRDLGVLRVEAIGWAREGGMHEVRARRARRALNAAAWETRNHKRSELISLRIINAQQSVLARDVLMLITDLELISKTITGSV